MVNHYIRAWRKHRGLTIDQLADMMEREPGVPVISSVSLGRIERGLQPYSQANLEAIADALDVTPALLLENDPEQGGQVLDLARMVNEVDARTRETIMVMVEAAINSARRDKKGAADA